MPYAARTDAEPARVKMVEDAPDDQDSRDDHIGPFGIEVMNRPASGTAVTRPRTLKITVRFNNRPDGLCSGPSPSMTWIAAMLTTVPPTPIYYVPPISLTYGIGSLNFRWRLETRKDTRPI